MKAKWGKAYETTVEGWLVPLQYPCPPSLSERDLLWNQVFEDTSHKKNIKWDHSTLRVSPKSNQGFPGGSDGKEAACHCRRPWLDPWVGKMPWRKGMATHSRILAWRIPWTGESGGLWSMGSQRLRHGWRTARSHTKSRDWCPYRDVRGQGNTEGRCCHEDRDRVMLSEAEECQQPQGCGGETLEFSSLQVLANALISALLFSSTVKDPFCASSSYPVCGTYCSNPRKLTWPTIFQTPRSMKSGKKKKKEYKTV